MRLIARVCKVFTLARKLNTPPADLESTPRPPQRVGLGLGSGVGSGWSGHRNRRFVRTCTQRAAIHKSLLNLRANLNSVARTRNFAGAGRGAISRVPHTSIDEINDSVVKSDRGELDRGAPTHPWCTAVVILRSVGAEQPSGEKQNVGWCVENKTKSLDRRPAGKKQKKRAD